MNFKSDLHYFNNVKKSAGVSNEDLNCVPNDHSKKINTSLNFSRCAAVCNDFYTQKNVKCLNGLLPLFDFTRRSLLSTIAARFIPFRNEKLIKTGRYAALT